MSNLNTNTPPPAQSTRVTADGQITAGATRLYGWSGRETSSAGFVTFTIHDGTANTDPIIATYKILSGEAHAIWFGPGGISAPNGIYIDLFGTGTGDLTVWYE